MAIFPLNYFNVGLVCGDNNCRQFAAYFHEKDDCCIRKSHNSNFNDVYGNL